MSIGDYVHNLNNFLIITVILMLYIIGSSSYEINIADKNSPLSGLATTKLVIACVLLLASIGLILLPPDSWINILSNKELFNFKLGPIEVYINLFMLVLLLLSGFYFGLNLSQTLDLGTKDTKNDAEKTVFKISVADTVIFGVLLTVGIIISFFPAKNSLFDFLRQVGFSGQCFKEMCGTYVPYPRV